MSAEQFLRSSYKLWAAIQHPDTCVDKLIRLVSTDPLVCSVLALVSFIVLSYALNLLTRNYSWVDRMWSLTPPVYSLIFAWFTPATLPGAPRVWLAAALISLWGLRLSYNFYRKGGYNPSDEDYRWRIVRSLCPNRILWELFNLGFICVYQHTLIWSLTLPVYLLTVTQGKFVRTGWQDYAVAGLFLAFLVMETVADQQQWNFHQQKKRGASKKGFLTDGLYRYSRHPNFFAEMSLWWTVYLFTLTSSRVGGVQWKQLESLNWRSLINFTAIGPALLVLLFQGSTALTEWISTGKYPEYRTYQRTTSRLIPWFPSSAIAATDGDGKKRAVATAQPRTPRKQQASAAAASATPRRSSPRRAKVD